MIKKGYLKEATTDLYAPTKDGNFIRVLRNQNGFVTYDSVMKYIEAKRPRMREKGVSRKGVKIIAQLSDGTETQYDSKRDVCKYYRIAPKRLNALISTKQPLEVNIPTSRCEQLGVEPEPGETLTEHVYFRYACY